MFRRRMIGIVAAAGWACSKPPATGGTVHFGMWAGDEEANRFFQSVVAPRVAREHHIQLRLIPASDTAELIAKLLNEKRAGRTAGGSLDVLWLNGENFRSARRNGLLWGPFADRLPNAKLYDPASLERDFGAPIDGMEAPWQRTQYVFAHDTARTPEPPRSFQAFEDWMRVHPGRFTYVAPPDFNGSAFLRHLLVFHGGSAAAFHTFDAELYAAASEKAFAWLRRIRPYLWRRGETYPQAHRELLRMFANGEVDFAMGYGPAFASVRIARGEFPATVRTFLLESGTLGNYSYLAIPFNTSNSAAALVLINHLLSFEHMIEQSRRLGHPSPYDARRLSAEQRAAVEALPRGIATLPDAELAARFLPEPDSEYLSRLEKDWIEKVLRP